MFVVIAFSILRKYILTYLLTSQSYVDAFLQVIFRSIYLLAEPKSGLSQKKKNFAI